MIKTDKVRYWGIRCVVVLCLLLLLLYFALQTSYVQNRITKTILSSISDNYQAKWDVGNVKIDFFDQVTLDNVLFLDQKGDILLASDQIYLDISVFSLFQKEVGIDAISFKGLTSRIYSLDTDPPSFNYGFLLSTSEDNSEEASDGWDITVKEISIDDLDLGYQDQGLGLKTIQGRVSLDIDNLNLDQPNIDFNSVVLSDGRTEVHIYDDEHQSPSKETTNLNSDGLIPDIGVALLLKELQLTKQDIDLFGKNEKVEVRDVTTEIGDINWSEHKMAGTVNNLVANVIDIADIDEATASFDINGNVIKVGDLILHTKSQERIVAESLSIDMSNDLKFESMGLKAKLSAETIEGQRAYLPSSVQPVRGQGIELSANVLEYSIDRLFTDRLKVDYGSVLQLNSNLKINNLSDIDRISVEGALPMLIVDLDQVRKMFPDLDIPDVLSTFRDLSLSVDQVRGSMNQLNIGKAVLSIDEKNYANFSGQITAMNNPSEITYDLELDSLTADIVAMQIIDTSQVSLASLGHVDYKGTASGSRDKLTLIGVLKTDIGTVKSDVVLGLGQEEVPFSYDGIVELDSFDIGEFMQDDEFGMASLVLSGVGRGVDLKSIVGNLKGNVEAFDYRGYTYQNADVVANIDRMKVSSDISISDPNVKFEGSGMLYMGNDKVAVNLQGRLDTLVPSPLGFLDQMVGFQSDIRIDVELPLEANDTGFISLSDFVVYEPTRYPYRSDSILITLNKNIDTSFINLESPFLQLEAKGIFEISELPTAFMVFVNDYLPNPDTLDMTMPSGFISGRGEVKDIDLLHFMMPDQNIYLENGQFDVEADFDQHTFFATAEVDRIVYDDYIFETLSFVLEEEGQHLFAQVDADYVDILDKVNIENVSFINDIYDGKVHSKFIADQNESTLPGLQFETTSSYQQKGFKVSFFDSLIIGNTLWEVSPQNSISSASDGVVIRDMRFSRDNESFSVFSMDSTGANHRIRFDQFDLASFSEFISTDSVQIGGEITGNVDLLSLASNAYILSDFSIDNLSLNDIKIGQVVAKGNTDPESKAISSEVILSGENTARMSVLYDPNDQMTDLDLRLSSLDMRVIDILVPDLIKDSKGKIDGSIIAKGDINELSIEGMIHADTVATTILANNSEYTFTDHVVTFDESQIDIGELTLKDGKDNSAILSGNIYHNFFRDFNLDLSVDTDRFIFLNTTAQNNPILYGNVVLDADLKIFGPPEYIIVEAAAKTLENTAITLSPFSEVESILREDILSYGKPEDFVDVSPAELLKQAKAFPFDVNLLMETNDLATLNFIIDPIKGDEISGKGTGNLRIDISSDGEQEIFGTYYVNSGKYSFSYDNFITREFEIQEGSTVRFNGDPLNAQLDIKAVYKVYTSTYELIKDEATLSESEIRDAKGKSNIDVILALSGSLTKPQINLDIKSPSTAESSSIVSSMQRKLTELRQNSNELNNQVFGLLLFNRFLLPSVSGSSSFNSIGGDIALNSVSSLITSQLNALAKNAIKGVDVSFDINSYNSQYINEGDGGNVTELGLSVSKQLFNDRLKIQTSGNVNIEGQNGTGQFSSLVGDFVLDFRLSETGKYRMRVFSKSIYDRLLNQNTNKNGVSLYFSQSFDSKVKSPKE